MAIPVWAIDSRLGDITPDLAVQCMGGFIHHSVWTRLLSWVPARILETNEGCPNTRQSGNMSFHEAQFYTNRRNDGAVALYNGLVKVMRKHIDRARGKHPAVPSLFVAE